MRDVRPMVGRIVITLGPEGDAQWDEIRARLSHLPGIGNFARATHVAPDLDAIASAVAEAARERMAGQARETTFRVSARRADKRFPIPSPDIEREVGGRVQEATGWPVDLSNPELHIRVEVLTTDAFFSFRQGARRRRTADRHERPRAEPALRRHRLAGRRVAADSPRLPQSLRPLSQLSDPVAHVAGEGARARQNPHAATSCARACTSCRSAPSSSRSSSRCRRRCGWSSIAG